MMELELFNALQALVGEYWALFIVFAVVALCAAAQALMNPPNDQSSAFYRMVYAFTEKAGMNILKALNASRKGGE